MPHPTKRKSQAQSEWIKKREAYEKLAFQQKVKNWLGLFWGVVMTLSMYFVTDYAKNNSYSDLEFEIKEHNLTIRKLEACRYANNNR